MVPVCGDVAGTGGRQRQPTAAGVPQMMFAPSSTWVAGARNLTSWVAIGMIVALTGFGPEHWFATAFRYVEMPQAGLVWPAWLDIRAVIVSIGVLIVAADVLGRRMRQEKAAAGPAGARGERPYP